MRAIETDIALGIIEFIADCAVGAARHARQPVAAIGAETYACAGIYSAALLFMTEPEMMYALVRATGAAPDTTTQAIADRIKAVIETCESRPQEATP